jgi:hypothetical protein
MLCDRYRGALVGLAVGDALSKCPCGEALPEHFHTGKMVTRQAPVSAEIEKNPGLALSFERKAESCKKLPKR